MGVEGRKGWGAILGLELVGQDQVGITEEILVDGYYVLADVEAAIIAHDRVEDYKPSVQHTPFPSP